jgi:two-component system sensor histidine kinase DesK
MVPDDTRSVRTTWLYTLGSIVAFMGFFTVFVALMMLEEFRQESEALMATIIVLQLAAGAVQIRFCWYLRGGRGAGLPAPGWTVALVALAAAVWILSLATPGAGFLGAASLWAASCLVACLIDRRWRWPLLAVAAVALVAHAALAAAITTPPHAFIASSGAWPTAIYAAMLPFMLLTSVWFWEVVVELDEHRRAAAALAVARERLRFASDLHDIQGHHLQVISLKAELAERLLPVDVEAARENLHDVRTIAHRALAETRSLVAGYRRVSLDDELHNAREVLGATGARCVLRSDGLPADEAIRSVLALTVREATTNILRHSDAAEVVIATGRDRQTGGWLLRIVNDGVTDPASVPLAPSARTAGTGLAGLRERIVAMGGTLEAGIEGGRFVLQAVVPESASPEAHAAVSAEEGVS